MCSKYAFEEFFGIVPVIRFLPIRTRYFSRLHPAPAPPEVVSYLNVLKRDGVVIIPDFLDAGAVARMRDAVPDVAEFDESPEGDGAYRYPDADRIADFRPFFDHAIVPQIVRSYLSERAIPLHRTIGLKTRLGVIPTFEVNYHIDTWKLRVKAWLYLDYVGVENAPTVYLKGSHRGSWRYLHEARHHNYYRVDDKGFARDEDVFYVGSLWPHEIARLKNEYGYQEIVCTGKAGTLLVFDGRGLHRATPLQANRRLILTSYWIHPGDHV